MNVNVDVAAEQLTYGKWNFTNPQTTLKISDGKMNDWDNENGEYSIKMRNLIKKYFPTVKVGIIPWSVPQCAGGILFLIEADQETLNGILQKVKLNEEDYKFGTQEDARNMLSGFFG